MGNYLQFGMELALDWSIIDDIGVINYTSSVPKMSRISGKSYGDRAISDNYWKREKAYITRNYGH